MIRAATPADTEAIRRLAIDNHMFEPDEMDGFDEMMNGFFNGSLEGHSWIVALDRDEQVAGAGYFAPEPFADRMWNLYFLAVRPDGHGGGVGGDIITWVEQTLRELGDTQARVLIVETSSTDGYEQARSFYAKHGFVEEARIRQFYGPADDKVVFWKSLANLG
jgi:GNAT superfamily N-acetyltransferase